MKRFYYDCGIEAAYMAKNFNFSYANGDFDDAIEHAEQDRNECNFVLTPDSIKLLEPQEGDVMEFYDSEKQVVMVTPEERDCAVYEQGLPIDFIKEHNNEIFTIIQRNGKPFIYPKEETNATT